MSPCPKHRKERILCRVRSKAGEDVLSPAEPLKARDSAARASNSCQGERGSRWTPKGPTSPHGPGQPQSSSSLYSLSLTCLPLKSNTGTQFLPERMGRHGSIKRQREFLPTRARTPRHWLHSDDLHPQLLHFTLNGLHSTNRLPPPRISSSISTAPHHGGQGRRGVVEGQALDEEKKRGFLL